MTAHDEVIFNIRQLPEPLAQEVSDFVDSLLTKHDTERWQLWTQFSESQQVAEVDFSDYLANLRDYEEQLASGKIK